MKNIFKILKFLTAVVFADDYDEIAKASEKRRL
jgi:hypothetical protein